LEETVTLTDGRRVLLRPIRPEDEVEHYDFLSRLSSEDTRFRFFGKVGRLSHDQMDGLTHIDYDRHMAIIATAETVTGAHETLGVVRAIAEEDLSYAEFAIVVRSDIKNHGLGWKLLNKIIAYCRAIGVARMVGQVMPDNARMLRFARDLGFIGRLDSDQGVIEVTLDL